MEGQGEEGEARHSGGGGLGCGEPRGLAHIARGGAEIVSVANDVVSNVHGGVAGLVDAQAFVETPQHLESEQGEH